MIHYEIDLALFSLDEARRNLTAHDPQAQYALTLFPEAVRLLNVSRQTGGVAARRGLTERFLLAGSPLGTLRPVVGVVSASGRPD